MATARLLRSCRPMNHVHPPGTISSSSSVAAVKCIHNKSAALGGEKKMVSSGGEVDNKKKSAAASLKASAAAITAQSLAIVEPRVVDDGIIDLASLLSAVTTASLNVLKPIFKPKLRELQLQMLIEKAIIDCRFFSLFAVAGSLLSSVLCFVEGCFIIVESYIKYISSLTVTETNKGQMVHLLIEAMDMFLIGTAMLIFGVGLYTIFVGSKKTFKENDPSLPSSNFFKRLPTWVELESVSKAKSRIGHAVLMILQVGLMDKFKNIPLVTSLDLACFAGAILLSSASTFLLSKLSVAARDAV